MPDFLSGLLPPVSFPVPQQPSAAAYAAPLIGPALGKQISDLPGQYQQGFVDSRRREMMNAFPEGMPKNPDGTPNVNAIIDTGFKLGGVDYGNPLMQQLLSAQEGRQFAENMEGIERGARGQPSQPQQSSVGSQPQPSSMGTDGGGQVSIASLASETGMDLTPVLARIATNVGVQHPADPLSPEQISAARVQLSRAAQLARSTGRPALADPMQVAPQPAASVPSAGETPPFMPSPAKSVKTVSYPAPGGASGQAPQPSPTAGAQVAQAQPQQQPPASVRAAPAQAPAVAMPPGVTMQQINQWETAAGRLSQLEAQMATRDPARAAAVGKRAQQYADLAKQGREQLAKYNEPTGEQKNARDQNVLQFEGQKKLNEQQIVQSQKTYNGIQAASTQYERDLKPYLELSRSIVNDPSMYSGIGAERVLDVNRVRAAFGDRRAAMLQEALQKVTASSVLGQINTQRDQLMEAGGASSRIFAQQVSLVEKAAPALSNTLAGNRFLVEVSTRMGDLSTKVAQMAREYIAKNKMLDPKFDEHVSKYLDVHPIFTERELSNPELLGAPTAPASLKTKDAVTRWGKALGLRVGDPIRFSDGSVKAMQ